MSTGMSLVFALVLILLNGYFVCSEYALVNVRPTQLHELIDHGNKKAEMVLNMTDNLDKYLSSVQLGVTLASIGVGWLGEPAFASLFRNLFGFLNVDAGLAFHALAFTAAYLTATFPKTSPFSWRFPLQWPSPIPCIGFRGFHLRPSGSYENLPKSSFVFWDLNRWVAKRRLMTGKKFA